MQATVYEFSAVPQSTPINKSDLPMNLVASVSRVVLHCALIVSIVISLLPESKGRPRTSLCRIAPCYRPFACLVCWPS